MIGRSRTGRARAIGIRAGVALFALLLSFELPAPVRANDLDQFQNARAAFDFAKLRACGRFVPRHSRRLTTQRPPPLALESRKYLAAAVLFLGRRQEARGAVRAAAVPRAQLHARPTRLPGRGGARVLRGQSPSRGRSRQRELEQARAQAQQSQQSAEQGAVKKRRSENLARLIALRGHRARRGKALAHHRDGAVGVGQFQNDHDGLGLVSAVSEGTLLAASIASFFLHENLRDQNPDTASCAIKRGSPRRCFATRTGFSPGLFGVLGRDRHHRRADPLFKSGDRYERPRDCRPSSPTSISPSVPAACRSPASSSSADLPARLAAKGSKSQHCPRL